MRLFFLILVYIPWFVNAQISGIIINADTKQPVPDVLIISGGDTVSISNEAGFFHIEPSSVTDSIFFITDKYQHGFLLAESEKIRVIIELIPLIANVPEVMVASNLIKEDLEKIPGSTAVVTNEDILNRNEICILDYISEVPGLYSHQGTYNTNRLTIRGIGSRTPYSSNRIKAYYNEIPLTNGEGVSTIEDMDISGIERIEILKGPSSGNYGAGLGGVIRLYSKYPGKDVDEFQFKSTIGSYETLMNALTAYVKKRDFYIRTNVSGISSKGFRENNKYSRINLNTYGTYFHPLFTVSWLFHYVDLFAQIPSSLDYATYRQNPVSAAQNWFTVEGYEEYKKLNSGLTLSTPLWNKWSNSLTLFTGYFDQYELRPFNILDDRSFSYGFRERIQYSDKKLKFIIGTEYYTENYMVKIFDDQQQDTLEANDTQQRNYFNVFTMLSYVPDDRFNITVAGNFNSTSYEIKDELNADSLNHSGKYRFDPIFSPRVGINYQATEYLNVFSEIGHGFSVPSVEETLLPEGLINNSIKPETGWNIDLGLRLNLNRKIFTEVTYYWIFLENLLVTKRETEEIFYGINAGSTRHNGFEALVKYNFFKTETEKNRKLELTLSLTTSNNKFKSFIDDTNNYSGNCLPGIPAWWMNTSLKWKSGFGTTFFTEFKYSGKQYLNDTNSDMVADWWILNLSVMYDLIISKKFGIQIFFNVNNLLDERYASMILVNATNFGNNPPRYYYPGIPRNFKIGLSVLFY
ncbi:MAG: TonB-dependent receptor [Bacteroidales bacterium]|nr:TonB-dependent receptor [Bacteroidales bacterium]